MGTLIDMIITIVIVLGFGLLIDPPIARRIIAHFNGIKLLDYNKYKSVALFVTIISTGLIASIFYTLFGVIFSNQFIEKYDYILLAIVAFLGGIVVQIFLNQSFTKR